MLKSRHCVQYQKVYFWKERNFLVFLKLDSFNEIIAVHRRARVSMRNETFNYVWKCHNWEVFDFLQSPRWVIGNIKFGAKSHLLMIVGNSSLPLRFTIFLYKEILISLYTSFDFLVINILFSYLARCQNWKCCNILDTARVYPICQKF